MDHQIDYPRVIAHLQSQRNSAMDAHVVAAARADQLADKLTIAEAGVEELTAKLEEARAELNSLHELLDREPA